MFEIAALTSILEILVLMPGFFFILQFFLPATLAFMLACLFNFVAVAAILFSKLKPGPFVYKLVTIALSILIALVTAGMNFGSIITAVICIFVFNRVRTEVITGRDLSIQLATGAMFLNIPLGLFIHTSDLESLKFFGNIAICISAVTSILILVTKQLDESRRFGKNSMGVSRTQRKNNQVFAGILILILVAVSSFGDIAGVYKFVMDSIARFISLISSLFSPSNTVISETEQQMQFMFENAGVREPSLFEKIFLLILNVVVVIVLVAGILFLLFTIVKLLIRLIRSFVKWLRSGEHTIDTVSENGHTDEKESLLDRNLRNFVQRLQNMAEGISNRETPYDKLTDDTLKVRRLFKYFTKRVKAAGVVVSSASTAQEICRDAGGISPVTEQLNELLAHCYDKARYDNTAPTKEQLSQLEEKLLKG